MKFFKVRSRSERERERERVVAKPQQDKIYIFDFLRALACIGIIVHHILYHPTKRHIFIYSGIPMEIFFFVSGFLIPLSLQNCNIKQFFVKRFFRLMPVLLCALLSYCIILNSFGFRHIISNLLLIGDFWKKGEIVETSWSLKVEIKFYLICALSFFLFKNNRHRIYSMLFAYLCVFFVSVYFRKYPYIQHQSLTYVVQLMSGCFIASVYYFYDRKFISKYEFFLLSLVLFLFLLMQKNFFKLKFNTNSIHYCVGYLLALLLCVKYKNFGNNKIIKYLANISYSMYLFHMLFVRTSFKFVDHVLPIYLRNSTAYMFFYELILLIPCFCMCHFIYYYIEKPAYDYGRKLASKLK